MERGGGVECLRGGVEGGEVRGVQGGGWRVEEQCVQGSACRRAGWRV